MITVKILVEHEQNERTGVQDTLIFKWDLTTDQLIKLNDYANNLVEGSN